MHHEIWKRHQITSMASCAGLVNCRGNAEQCSDAAGGKSINWECMYMKNQARTSVCHQLDCTRCETELTISIWHQRRKQSLLVIPLGSSVLYNTIRNLQGCQLSSGIDRQQSASGSFFRCTYNLRIETASPQSRPAINGRADGSAAHASCMGDLLSHENWV